MPTYSEVMLYDVAGMFLGYAIMGPEKLQSTNIYREGEEQELRNRLNELTTSQDVRKYWPSPRDPEVIELLNRPDFEPIEMHSVQVVDLDNSPRIVYHQVAGKHGWENSDEIDEEASELTYKSIEVPVQPTDQIARIRAACETVAKARAGLV